MLNFGRPHECVNFEAVNEWAGDRAVDVSPPGYLVHPTLGLCFFHKCGMGGGKVCWACRADVRCFR